MSLNRNRPIRFYAQNWGDFDPIPELNQTNDEADLTLLALSTNDVIFEQLVTDPWYSATTEVESQEAGQALRYFSDHPASFVGCKVQHQWCEPNENRCTQLAAFNKVALEAQTLSYSAVQNASVYAMTWALNMAPSIETIVDRLGVSALTSRYTLNHGIQGPLPTNQWQTEIQHLHSTSLAALQRMTVEQASGPNDRSVKRFFIPPDNDMERKARCQQVRGFSKDDVRTHMDRWSTQINHSLGFPWYRALFVGKAFGSFDQPSP